MTNAQFLEIKKLKKMLLKKFKDYKTYDYVEGRKLKSKCPVCGESLKLSTDHDEPNNFYCWFIKCPTDNDHFDPECNLEMQYEGPEESGDPDEFVD